jgi:hypothetical protein
MPFDEVLGLQPDDATIGTIVNTCMQNKWDLMLIEMRVSTTSKLCIILCLQFLFEVPGRSDPIIDLTGTSQA